MRNELGDEDFSLWFKNVVLRVNEDKTVLTAEATELYVLDWIQRKYKRLLQAAFQLECGGTAGVRLSVEFVVKSPDSAVSSESASVPAGTPSGSVSAVSSASSAMSVSSSQDWNSTVETVGYIPGFESSVQESRAVGSEKEHREKLAARRRRAAEERERLSQSSSSDSGQLFSQTVDSCLSGKSRPAGRFSGSHRQCGTFKSFVVGKANENAYKTAELVLNEPGAISPVVFIGTPGVGKTHLLEAIRYEALRFGYSVEYETINAFTAQFVSAIRTSTEARDAFRERFVSPSFLILDNLQHLLGKRSTTAELLQIVTEVQRSGHQVIFACDRLLNELEGLGKDMYSYLKAGVRMQLQTPDFDLRMRILERMAADRGISISREQRQMFARQTSGDVRELLGALNTLRIFSRTEQAKLSWDTALSTSGEAGDLPTETISKRSMDEVLSSISCNSVQLIPLTQILRVVCEVFGVTQEALLAGGRTQRITQPRMLAMWLARKYTQQTYSEIGDFFGCSSHTSVISAKRKVEEWVSKGTLLRTARDSSDAMNVIQRIEAKLHYAS